VLRWRLVFPVPVGQDVQLLESALRMRDNTNGNGVLEFDVESSYGSRMCMVS
jgi:hypothetical protein